MSHVPLSIVIGTYNREDLLQKCLEALNKGVHVDHEIIVADASPGKGILENMEPIAGLRVVKDDGLAGQAKSLNRLFKDLDSEYVCWLSDDNVVVDAALDVAVECLRTNPDIGMIALKVKDTTGPYTKSPYLGSIWESGILNCNQGMLPTKLLQRLGGFDEEFRDYGIDVDLTTRVLLEGFKVAYTKCVAIHHYRNHEDDSWITGRERNLRLERARELYRRKYDELINNRMRSELFPKLQYSFLDKHYAGVLLLIVKITKNRSLAQSIDSHLRDCSHIAKSRFISRWDLIRNMFKPYYLVQKIPESIRKHINMNVHINQTSKVDIS
jgi:GT2 family glycosyltransferase